MAHPQIAAFARLAEGAAEPTRRIEGQETRLSRTMHAIEYDAAHDEFVVPQQLGQAILTFRGGAAGQEAPIRVIQGSRTRLRRPDRLAVDPVHDEIFVPEGNAILVFPRGASGNVAPIRVIEGPDTKLLTETSSSAAIAVDPVHNVIVMADEFIVTFNRTDSGNVKPQTFIAGPRTGLKGTRGLAVQPEGGWILAFASEPGPGKRDNRFIGVWHHTDTGDVPPRFRIADAGGVMLVPRGLAIDARHQTVIASDKSSNAILTFLVREIFSAP